MATKQTIGANIRKMRVKAGLSQNDVSSLCGIEKSRLSRYENDHIVPRVDTIEVLAGALNVKPQDIVGWK